MACNQASGLASKMCGPTVGAFWSDRCTRTSHKSTYDRSSHNGHQSSCQFNVEIDREVISIQDQDADTVRPLFLAIDFQALVARSPRPSGPMEVAPSRPQGGTHTTTNRCHKQCNNNSGRDTLTVTLARIINNSSKPHMFYTAAILAILSSMRIFNCTS